MSDAFHPFVYARAQHQHPTPPTPSGSWIGFCQIFVRSCYGIAALWPSAASAWEHAKRRHKTSNARAIPRGVPVFWTGGTGGFGHVALSRGDGSVWSTDFVRAGRVDVADIDAITRGWGLKLVGWTEDLNGVRVWEPPRPVFPHVDRATAQLEAAATRRPRVRAAIRRALKALRPYATRREAHK